MNKSTAGFIDKFKSKRQSFTCENFHPELRHFLRVFRKQLAWLVVKFLCLLRQQIGKAFCNLREFDVSRSEELEVNQWIVQDIHWFSSQSERAKKTIHCFSIYLIDLYTPK